MTEKMVFQVPEKPADQMEHKLSINEILALELEDWYRKPFPVKAVRVTFDNIKAVSVWCNGEIHNDGDRIYIQVAVNNAISEKQTQAHIGDWVLKSKDSFKVYTDTAFQRNFDKMM